MRYLSVIACLFVVGTCRGQSGRIFWCDYRNQVIQSADLDGHDVRDVFTNLMNPAGLAIDPSTGYFYWTEEAPSTCHGRLRRPAGGSR